MIRKWPFPVKGLIAPYRSMYSSWFCTLMVFPSMYWWISSPTISISSARAACCAFSSVQSHRVACTKRMSSRIWFRSAISLPNARRNISLMSFSYRCGVVQWWSPLNLSLHCQMMQRYLSVECHTALILAKNKFQKNKPQRIEILWRFVSPENRDGIFSDANCGRRCRFAIFIDRRLKLLV